MQSATSKDQGVARSDLVPPDLNTLVLSDQNDGPATASSVGSQSSTQGIVQEASYESPSVKYCKHGPGKDMCGTNCDRDNLLRVKTGNGSVVTTCITAELLVDDHHTEVGPPSFFQSSIHLGYENISFDPNLGYKLISNVSRMNYGGPSKIESTVILINPEPIPDSPGRHDLMIQTGSAATREKLNMEPVKVLYFPNSNIPDAERIYNHVRHYSDLALYENEDEIFQEPVYRLSRYVDCCKESYDNCMIYAKLFYYAYLLDIFVELNVVPDVTSHQPENEPKWLNFNIGYNASAPAYDLAKSIDEAYFGSIILEDGFDMFGPEMNVLRFLTDDGNKISTPTSGPVPHALFILWPAIPFAIFSNKPRPPPVDAVLVEPFMLRSFAQMLAYRRGEWHCLVKGAYIATELMGTRFKKVLVPGEEVPQWWPLRSNLSLDPVILPRPTDNNFMNRVSRVFPTCSDEIKTEAQAFLSKHSSAEYIRYAVLYNAVLSSATSTYLHGMNVNTALLKSWGTGKDVPHKFSNHMLKMNTNWGQGSPHQLNREPPVIACPRKAFKIWLGVGVYPELYCSNSHWWGQQGSVPQAEFILQDMDDNTIPHLYNPLCLDNLLLVRPMEWAVLGIDTSVDLSGSVLYTSNSNRGWHSTRGSNMFYQRSISKEPHKLVVYGAQVMQAILNVCKFTSSDLPPVSVVTCQCEHNATFTNHVFISNPPVVAPISASQYDETLNMFKPFTFRSYSWSKDRILCPALLGEALDSRRLSFIENMFRGHCRNKVGINLLRKKLCLSCAMTLSR